MKKKIFKTLILVLTLVVIATLAGCKKKASKAFVVPAEVSKEKVTITFKHTLSKDKMEFLDQYIKEFNKIYPNITVDHESVGGYDAVRNLITKNIAVGEAPDMAYCYPDHVALYNKAKAVVDLNKLIDSDLKFKDELGNEQVLGLTKEQKDDFVKGYYEEGTKFAGGNHMYTLPFSKSTEVLYYNKTFFEKEKLTVPTTWDEMYTVAKKIKSLKDKSIPLGYDSSANWFITMTEQLKTPYTSAEGDHFIFDAPKNREFVKEFKGWYDEGLFTTQKLFGGYTSKMFTQEELTPEGTVNPGKSYMTIGSSAGAKYQVPKKNSDGNRPFEMGIAMIPQADKENPKVISQGPSLCLFNNKNPNKVVAAWLFTKYITTTPEFQAGFSQMSGYVPVIKSASKVPTYAAFLDKADGGDYATALSVKQCIAQQDAYFVSPAFVGSSAARDEVGALMDGVFTSTDKVDDAIEKAFKKALNNCEYKAG